MHKLTPAQRWTLILAPVNDIYLTLPSLPYCTTKYIILYEPGIRDSRPLFARNQGDAGIVSCAETDGGASRHRAFSHHCANLLATDPEAIVTKPIYSLPVTRTETSSHGGCGRIKFLDGRRRVPFRRRTR